MVAPTFKKATDSDPGDSTKYGAPDVKYAFDVLDGTHATDRVQASNIETTGASNVQTDLDSKLANVVEDTTPQLGGQLAAAGNSILWQAADGIVTKQTGNKLVHTLADQNGAGIRLASNGGNFDIINSATTPGEVQPELLVDCVGSTRAFIIQVDIPAVDDTGSRPAIILDGRDLSPGGFLTVRPIYHLRNNSTVVHAVEADGTHDFKTNTLTNIGDITSITNLNGQPIANYPLLDAANVFTTYPQKVGALALNDADTGIAVARTMTSATNTHGFTHEDDIDASAAGTGHNSFDSKLVVSGTDNYDHVVAFQARPTFGSTGTIDRIQGLTTSFIQNGGVATSAQHIRINDPTGTGSITNQYGFYIPTALSKATNNYAVWTQDGNRHRLGGTSEIIDAGTPILRVLRFANSAETGRLDLQHARGTEATPLIIQNNDQIGDIRFKAFDGVDTGDYNADYLEAASITALVDGTPSTSSMPGRLELSTTPTGSTTPTLRLTVGQDGTADFEGNTITNIADITSITNLNGVAIGSYALATGDTFTGVHDFGGATSLEIPNSATPTVDAAGEIAVDTTIADHTGLIKYHDGTEELTVVGMPTANLTTTDGHTIKYNASNDEFEMSAGGSFFIGGHLYDTLADNLIEFAPFWSRNGFGIRTQRRLAAPMDMTIKNLVVDIAAYSLQTNAVNPVVFINGTASSLSVTTTLNTPGIYTGTADVSVSKDDYISIEFDNTGNTGSFILAGFTMECEPA